VLQENIIKKTQDGQKAAKLAIFALHQGDMDQTALLLQACSNCIHDNLLCIVDTDPPLQTQGCFTRVLEELADQIWLFGDTAESTTTASPICLCHVQF
jgi:hypothetical protein